MKKPKFVRSDYMRHLKLGKKKKSKRKWRTPRGEHNKIRVKRFGYPRAPVIGYGTPRAEAGLVNGKAPFVVNNMKELEKATAHSLVIIGRTVGAKKKIELIKEAEERKLTVQQPRTRRTA